MRLTKEITLIISKTLMGIRISKMNLMGANFWEGTRKRARERNGRNSTTILAPLSLNSSYSLLLLKAIS